MHPPEIPAAQFAGLPEQERERFLTQYREAFRLAEKSMYRGLLKQTVEQLPTIDVLLIRSAFQNGDTAEIGRIFANALTNTLCADAVAFAAGQKALVHPEAA